MSISAPGNQGEAPALSTGDAKFQGVNTGAYVAPGSIMAINGTGRALYSASIPSGDATSVLQAAINAIVTAGAGVGSVLVGGSCQFTQLDCTGLGPSGQIAFVGMNPGYSISGQASSLRCTVTTAADGIKANGIAGIGFYWCSVRYTTNGYTGKLINCTGSGFVHGDSCLFRPEGTADSHVALIYLDKAITADFVNCAGEGSKVLYGKSANASYSNGVRWRGGYLAGRGAAPVWNPGSQWKIVGTTVEPLTSGAPGLVNHDAGVLAQDLEVDVLTADDTIAGAWITFAGAGCRVGGLFSLTAAGSAAVAVNGTSDTGVTVKSGSSIVNNAAGAFVVDLSGATTPGPIEIGRCAYANTPTALVHGTIPGGSLISAGGGPVTYYGDSVSVARQAYADVVGRYIDLYGVVGDAGSRLRIRGDGLFQWGDGTGTVDVNLSRATSANAGPVLDLNNGGLRLQGRCKQFSGTGAPTIGGDVGDLYWNQAGGAGTTLYRCTVAGAAGAATWAGIL